MAMVVGCRHDLGDLERLARVFQELVDFFATLAHVHHPHAHALLGTQDGRYTYEAMTTNKNNNEI